MTSPASASAQEVMTTSIVYACAVVLLFYDHLLTLGREIRLIWRWPLRPLSIAFLVNRYFAFSINIVRLAVRLQSVPIESCHAILQIRNLFLTLSEVFICGLQLWRVSALYNHNKKVLGAMVFFLLTLLCFVVWAILTGTEASVVDQPGCAIQESASSARRVSTSWICILIWDVSIIGLTVLKTWRAAKATHRLTGRRFVSYVLLRDGIAYFILIGMIYFANILTFYSRSFTLLRGTFSWFAACASTAMMSRLMLNLKENLEARVIDEFEDDYNTVDVRLSDIVLRQLGELEQHDLENTNNHFNDTR